MQAVCRSCGELKKIHSNGLCDRCYHHENYVKNRVARIKYSLEWRQQNKEKYTEWCKKYNKEYLEKHPEKRRESLDHIKRFNDLVNFGGNKEKVLVRDNHRCYICGHDRNLVVHHILGRSRNEIKNLITLCPNCHADITSGYWTEDFIQYFFCNVLDGFTNYPTGGS